MISVKIDTSKAQAYFERLAIMTSREMPKFIQGQAVSLVSKVHRSLRNVEPRRRSISKIFRYYRSLKSGKAKGVRVAPKAFALAKAQASGGFAHVKTKDEEKKLGRLRYKSRASGGTKKLSVWQLAVRYTFGLRRKGVGSVRSGFAAGVKALDTRGPDSEFTFSKYFQNPKSPQTWAASIKKGRFSFVGVFEHGGLDNSVTQKAVQRGVNWAGADMERHYFKKTGELLNLTV